MRKTASALLVALLAGALQGCVGMAVGGAVIGTLATADRRTLGTQTDDATINVKAAARIKGLTGDEGHVNVTSYNRRVLLTGEVRDEAMREAVVREARAVDGVQNVTDELVVAPPSGMTARSGDTLITTRVKAALVENKEVPATAIKVVTERGTVFLLGRVTQREGEVATEAARTIPGVQKVVKLFEYLTDAELRQLTPGR